MAPGPTVVVKRKPRVSRLAIASMILGLLAIPTAFVGLGVVLGLMAVVLAILALHGIGKNPENVGGKGFALAGILTGLAGAALFVVVFVVSERIRELHTPPCAANINGMLKAMLVYANEYNDYLPVPPAGTSRPDYNPLAYDPRTPAGNNNSLSPVGILIAEGSISTKSLLCRDDPFVSRTPGTSAGSTLITVSISRIQNSYSIVAPWTSPTPTSEIGPWWKAKINSETPLMTDMALSGPPVAGKPPGNSANHKGDGQNVGFADGHVEWLRDISKLASDSRTTFPLPATQPSQPMMTPHRTATGNFVIP